MTTQTLAYQPVLVHHTLAETFLIKCIKFVKSLIPPRRVILSLGLLLVGLGIPIFMLLELIPATLLMGFFGLAFITIGGLLTLFYI